MAGKPVAVVGDVTAAPAAPSGTLTWQVKPPGVSYIGYTYSWLTVGGKAVIHGATCDFLGTDSSSGATTTSTVTLPKSGAPATTLQHGASNVLRDGDSADDMPVGNTLTVSATGILTSA